MAKKTDAEIVLEYAGQGYERVALVFFSGKDNHATFVWSDTVNDETKLNIMRRALDDVGRSAGSS